MNGTLFETIIGKLDQPCREELQSLQAVLTQLKLPATVDRRGRPRSGEGPQVTVVLLAELEEVLSIFLEGNRQCPDSFLYVPTTTWISREPSPSNSSLDTLYVLQAVTADSGGRTYLDVFKPPRRVTYLDNHLYAHVTRCGRNEGEKLGSFGLDMPTCSSVALNARTDDKLLTTLTCAAVDVPHPITLGLWLPGGYQHHYPHHYPTVTVVKLTSRDEDKVYLERVVRNFLGSTLMEKYQKVVVKPYGSAWNSCKGVSYHDLHDVHSVLQAVLHLLTLIDSGSGILVQSYHATFTSVPTPDLGRHSIDVEDVKQGFRVRAIVVRTPDNGVCMSQVVCAIGDSSRPIGGVTAVPTSLSLTLCKWGVRDREKQRAIYRAVRDNCEKLMLALLRQEAVLTHEQRGGHGSQTELLGIDLILTQQQKTIVPVLIEVNAHDCLYHVTVMEMMQPELKGQAVAPLVHTMFQRSLCHLLAGKTVLVIGGGGYSKRQLWTDAGKLGVKLVLVDSDPDHAARHDVDTFLHVDMTDHTQDVQHANTIVRLLRQRLPDRQVDGCLTVWEDCVPLAARVGQVLGLQHAMSVEAALNAKSKARTHTVLGQQAVEPPHDLPPSVYASPVVKVDSVGQVDEAMKKISPPAVMKPEFGSSAVGVKHVNNVKEAEHHITLVQNTLRKEMDHPGVGLGHGQSMILMPRLQGTEHDVDIVLYEDQTVAAFVSDNGPTRLPLCTETTAVMPSVLRKEQKQHLICAAASCCRGLGLHTGVFNVEMMMTPCGPRLLEINARMGGFYLRNWIRLIYNVDIFHLALMCACGVRPVLPGCSSLDEDQEDFSKNHVSVMRQDSRKGYIMGIMLCSSRHAEALATTASPQRLQLLHQRGDVIFSQFEAKVEPNDGTFEDPYGNLAVRASHLNAAKTKLIGVCASFGLETEESILEGLSDFVELT